MATELQNPCVSPARVRSTPSVVVKKACTVACLFLIPLVLDGPQIIVGSIVNFALAMLASHKLRARVLVLACILPSLSAIANGIMFGPLTMTIIPMVPFIWAGNAVLVKCIRPGVPRDAPAKVAVAWIATGIAVKFLVVSSGASILVISGVLPAIMLPPFSIVQAITTTIGAGSYSAIVHVRSRLASSFHRFS